MFGDKPIRAAVETLSLRDEPIRAVVDTLSLRDVLQQNFNLWKLVLVEHRKFSREVAN